MPVREGGTNPIFISGGQGNVESICECVWLLKDAERLQMGCSRTSDIESGIWQFIRNQH